MSSPFVLSTAMAEENTQKKEGKRETKAAIENSIKLTADPKTVDQWRQLKFGMFVHWGPVSLQGTEIGWSRMCPRTPWTKWKFKGSVPIEVYDNLYKKFNPVKFDADEWVQIAKETGMRYLVFTTKHHDGFCNFDSKWTDYKITSPECPYGKEIVGPLADACHKGGILWGVYYSQPDWHHPDYFTENHDKYIEYLHDQVRELMTNYGKVNMLFFDGLGGKETDWDGKRLIAMCRELQPEIMINNRSGVRADFGTPEQRIGKMQTDRPWETCMTLCHQWSWKPNDELKSLEKCIRVLVRVVGGDGNLLLNVGPMPDGRIEPRQAERLREIGDWLKKYGESIYDTRGGPFPVGDWGASTHRGNTIYLHILDKDSMKIYLPTIDKNIVSYKIITGGSATIEERPHEISISVSPQNPDEPDSIIKIELDGPASEVKLLIDATR